MSIAARKKADPVSAVLKNANVVAIANAAAATSVKSKISPSCNWAGGLFLYKHVRQWRKYVAKGKTVWYNANNST